MLITDNLFNLSISSFFNVSVQMLAIQHNFSTILDHCFILFFIFFESFKLVFQFFQKILQLRNSLPNFVRNSCCLSGYTLWIFEILPFFNFMPLCKELFLQVFELRVCELLASVMTHLRALTPTKRVCIVLREDSMNLSSCWFAMIAYSVYKFEWISKKKSNQLFLMMDPILYCWTHLIKLW